MSSEMKTTSFVYPKSTEGVGGGMDRNQHARAHTHTHTHTQVTAFHSIIKKLNAMYQ